MNGRTNFRSALQCKNKDRLPLVSFVYGLAARTANVRLSEMVFDEDCYSNALEGFYRLLGNEVILSNFDITVESEAFGSEVEWPGEYNAPILLNPGGLSNIEPEEFMVSGRVPVVMEVTRRLGVSLGREAAITCALTGPCSFIMRALSCGNSERTAADAIKYYGRYFTRLVRGVCELKIDALFFREDPLETGFLDVIQGNKEAYKSLYGTLFNIVKAYNAFPVLVTKNLQLDAINEVHAMTRPTGLVLLGNTFDKNELLILKKMADSHKLSFGLPLPIGTRSEEELWSQLSCVETFVHKDRPQNFFYTSDGEIQHDIEMELLHTLMSRMNEDLGCDP